jgi:hypothetical protein
MSSFCDFFPHTAPGSGKSTLADAYTKFRRGMGWCAAITAHTGVAVAGRGRTLYSLLGLKPDKKGNFPIRDQFHKLFNSPQRMKKLAKLDVCRLFMIPRFLRL